MSLINNTKNCFEEGGMSPSMGSPWFERREASDAIKAYHPGGLYSTHGAGRTDNIENLVPAGAYVIPADVVSGLGEGNTLSGAAVMDRMFHSMPHGIMPPRLVHGHGAPSAPHKFAAGGAPKDGTVPIIAAGGEYVVNPKALIKKFGSLKRAHKIMDAFVLHVRNKTANEMLKLKGPKQ